MCQSRRHSISHHFVSISDIAIYEIKPIRKCLNSCTLTNTQTSILAFMTSDKTSFILCYVLHLWCLRMQWFIFCLRLYRIRNFIPRPHTISCHEFFIKFAHIVIVI